MFSSVREQRSAAMELAYSQQTPFGFALPEAPVEQWTVDQVASFMRGIGLPQYAEQFREHDVGGGELLTLDKEDLRLVGVESLGHRIRIADDVMNLKTMRVIAGVMAAQKPPEAEAPRAFTIPGARAAAALASGAKRLACGPWQRRAEASADPGEADGLLAQKPDENGYGNING
jgi:hypothetical protein